MCLHFAELYAYLSQVPWIAVEKVQARKQLVVVEGKVETIPMKAKEENIPIESKKESKNIVQDPADKGKQAE